MNIPLRSSKFPFIGLIPHEFDPAKIFITPRRRREARPRDAGDDGAGAAWRPGIHQGMVNL